MHASLIVVLTRGGSTARLVAKYRPSIPVLTVAVPVLTTDSLTWSCSGVRIEPLRDCTCPRLPSALCDIDAGRPMRFGVHEVFHSFTSMKCGNCCSQQLCRLCGRRCSQLSIVIATLTLWLNGCAGEAPARQCLVTRGLLPLLAEGSARATDSDTTDEILHAAIEYSKVHRSSQLLPVPSLPALLLGADPDTIDEGLHTAIQYSIETLGWHALHVTKCCMMHCLRPCSAPTSASS